MKKKILGLLALSLLITTVIAEGEEELSEEERFRSTGLMIYYAKGAEGLSVVIGVFYIIGLYFSILLMLVDVYFRYIGKPRRWMGVYRFVIFNYGVCTPFIIGSLQEKAYRGAWDHFVRRLYKMVYLGGVMDSFVVKIMPDVTNSSGAVFPTYFNYFNVIFIYLLIWLIIGLLCVVFRVDYKNKGNFSNMIYMVMYVIFYSTIFPFVHWSLFFFKQGWLMRQSGGGYDKAVFHYVFGYIFAVVMLIPCLILWVRIFYTSKIAGGPLLKEILKDHHSAWKGKGRKGKKALAVKMGGRSANDPRNLGQSQYIANPLPPADQIGSNGDSGKTPLPP